MRFFWMTCKCLPTGSYKRVIPLVSLESQSGPWHRQNMFLLSCLKISEAHRAHDWSASTYNLNTYMPSPIFGSFTMRPRHLCYVTLVFSWNSTMLLTTAGGEPSPITSYTCGMFHFPTPGHQICTPSDRPTAGVYTKYRVLHSVLLLSFTMGLIITTQRGFDDLLVEATTLPSHLDRIYGASFDAEDTPMFMGSSPLRSIPALKKFRASVGLVAL
ncbi:hypothetical protein B0H67DRAFT_83512 [Lasiosphaeris hirsuta]|uniref:Uncharacterized protein n=1 Tax=Lasiosphaeris hirsuta TaxID=260670 RepID=A0AA40BD29_9PEZI|nr:hypothetical protein B0H67DRAFT_83512 [Lasiosphaeris hirsuta]